MTYKIGYAAVEGYRKHITVEAGNAAEAVKRFREDKLVGLRQIMSIRLVVEDQTPKTFPMETSGKKKTRSEDGR
jgi:hypothetical protein